MTDDCEYIGCPGGQRVEPDSETVVNYPEMLHGTTREYPCQNSWSGIITMKCDTGIKSS